MRLNEFENKEDDNTTPEYLKKNHPEIYAFMEQVIGYMALEQQTKVEMWDSTAGHNVQVALQPAASVENTALSMKRYNIPFERLESASGLTLSGKTADFEFRIAEGGYSRQPGNMIEEFRFFIPNEV